MEKKDLLRLLDRLSEEEVSLGSIMRVLEVGPDRTLEIKKNSLPILKTLDDLKFLWNRHDPRTAISCLLAQGFYERIETNVLKYFGNLPGSVIDIGANVGYYSIVLGKLISDNDSLIAIEANSKVFSQLRGNIEINDLNQKVIALNILLSDKESLTQFYEPKTSGSSASSLRNLHPAEDTSIESLISVRLDNIEIVRNLKAISLIKIDVEGAELEVVKGALETITQNSPIIFIELLRKWSKIFGYHPNEVLDTLKPLGYKAFEINRALNFIEKIDESTNSTNFLLVIDNEDNRRHVENLRFLLKNLDLG